MLLATTRFLIGLARPPVGRDEGLRLSIAETHDLMFARSDAGLLTAAGHLALLMDSKLDEFAMASNIALKCSCGRIYLKSSLTAPRKTE